MDRLGPAPEVRKSKMNVTLLENYMLALSIMSNIAQKFINEEHPCADNRRI